MALHLKWCTCGPLQKSTTDDNCPAEHRGAALMGPPLHPGTKLADRTSDSPRQSKVIKTINKLSVPLLLRTCLTRELHAVSIPISCGLCHTLVYDGTVRLAQDATSSSRAYSSHSRSRHCCWQDGWKITF